MNIILNGKYHCHPYTFRSLPFNPWLGLRADIASGDKDPVNADLQTFNPLFPKGAYFSEAGLVGPANFIDLNLCLDLHFSDRVTLTFDWDFFWLQSIHEGLYNNAVATVRSGKSSAARYVGSMSQVQLSWDLNQHLSFTAIYGHFFTGRFLRDSAASEDIDYLTTWLTCKF